MKNDLALQNRASQPIVGFYDPLIDFIKLDDLSVRILRYAMMQIGMSAPASGNDGDGGGSTNSSDYIYEQILPQDGTFFKPFSAALYFVAMATDIGDGPLEISLMGTDDVEIGSFSLDQVDEVHVSPLLAEFPAGIKPVVISGVGTYSILARLTKS